MRISDWSSVVCSSDLRLIRRPRPTDRSMLDVAFCVACAATGCDGAEISVAATRPMARVRASAAALSLALLFILLTPNRNYGGRAAAVRSEEHTSELQSLMRISYAVFCLKKKKLQP